MPDTAFIAREEPRPELRPGARNIVETCLSVAQGDRVVVVTDEETAPVASAVIEALATAGAETSAFLLERHGSRPLSHLPAAVLEALEGASVSVLMVQPEPGELRLRARLVDVARERGLRHAHMPGVDERAMVTAMRADFVAVSRLQDRLLDVMGEASSMQIRAPGGTDLTLALDAANGWVRNDGLIRPGVCQNLPAGLLQTTPADADGTYVADAAIGDWFGRRYGDLSENPLAVTLRRGRVVSAESPDSSLARQLLLYVRSNDNGDRVGELGLGTNTALDSVVGNVLHDQNLPGAVITLGGAAATVASGASWSSRTHVPLVARDCEVDVDGAPIMRAGRYLDHLLS